MAVDFTKLFTVLGKETDKINDYYSLLATLTSDQSAIVTAMTGQSIPNFIDGIDAMYDTFRSNIVSWIQQLISKQTVLLTDPDLVTNNFPFGTTPGVQQVWQALIKYMYNNDYNVKASVITTGSVTRTVQNSEAGYLAVSDVLDGYNPPMSGAVAVPEYTGLTSQMYPDDETITFTCIQDSEGGTQQGAERFSVAGTGVGSAPYSVSGENVGSLGSIQVADSLASQYVSNPSFESWGDDGPTGWAVNTGVLATDFNQSAAVEGIHGDSLTEDYAFVTGAPGGAGVAISQVLTKSLFTRNRAYFLSCWAKRLPNGGDGTTSGVLSIGDNSGGYVSINVTPTSSTTWTLYKGLFVVPAEIDLNLALSFLSVNDAAKDSIYLDQIVITPATYIAGAAFAIFGGRGKFLVGDTLAIRLQNDNAGKFQTWGRKAYKIQIPTDGTPTISDSLVA